MKDFYKIFIGKGKFYDFQFRNEIVLKELRKNYLIFKQNSKHFEHFCFLTSI